jgi:F0F1-type ATP synthase assembly protein I
MKIYKNSLLVYMNYIWEAILVGIYEVFLFLLISHYIENFYILLLVVGFSKHIVGYILGIHTWYCNNGYACINKLHQYNKNQNNNKNNDKNKITYVATSYHLIQDSIKEAIVHLFLGIVMSYFLSGSYLFFTLGLILHILAEKLGVHNNFCREICHKENTN